MIYRRQPATERLDRNNAAQSPRGRKCQEIAVCPYQSGREYGTLSMKYLLKGELIP
jgi:hypothetical protein